MKIVVAEDEEALLHVLAEKLRNNGFEVREARDGEAAMKAIKNFLPDLVLLDLLMPQKDGFAVLEEMKASTEFKSIPVIVLSNLGEDEDLKRALHAGAVDYLVKMQHPLNEVVEKVKKYLITKSK